MEAEVLNTRKPSPTRQSRILQLRNARFRAAPVNPRTTVSANESGAFFDKDSSPTSELDPSGSYPGTSQSSTPPSDASPIGAVQEIRNSSMRRRRKNGDQMDNIVEIAAEDEDFQKDDLQACGGDQISYDLDGMAPGHTPSRTPPRPEYQRPSYSRSARSSIIPRRACSNETSRYVEHLESQIVSLQTQLQSLTSPSHTKAQTAKLRAMTSESRLLREEIADWEQHFEDRLAEQVEQHDLALNSLRSHVKILESEKAAQTDKIQELEVETDSKSRNFESLENANRELERRLDFFSELVASSPTKVHLHPNLLYQKDSKASRRTWYGPAADTSHRPGITSPERRRSFQPSQPFGVAASQSIPQTPAAISPHLDNNHPNPIDQHPSPFSTNRNSLDSLSVTSSQFSEATLVDPSSSGQQSPSKRSSLIRSPTFETNDTMRGSKPPCRRMRRFHTGSTGPRSLILPKTSHAGTYPASAPVGVTPTTESVAEHREEEENLTEEVEVCMDSPSDDKDRANDVSQRCRRVRRQSSTWDEEELRSSKRRKDTFVNWSTLSTFQVDFSSVEDDCSPEDSVEKKSRGKSPDNRFGSIRSAPGKSLFEELGGIRQDSEEVEEHEDSTLQPGEAVKHLDDAASEVSLVRSAPTHEYDDSSRPQVRRSKENVTTTNGQTDDHILSTNPGTSIHNLQTIFGSAFFTHFDPARTIFQRSYQHLISKPALEFRWWLVTLLIGRVVYHNDQSRKATRTLKDTPASSTHISTSSTPFGRPVHHTVTKPDPPIHLEDDNPSTADPLTEDYVPSSLHLNLDAEREYHPPIPTPVYWLKFGMTLVAAVGLAVRDGPGCLLGVGGEWRWDVEREREIVEADDDAVGGG